ncbi:SCO-spondin-like isoform X2 [Manacus candei]|uniref:SCO-spondin-like isoform X2 n=1 Tax=Manacus candei TaxID=415023 RepID=UPI0022274C1D|nr:SCO-spondin-like isoform X2 [Manacus candei]
MSTGCQEEDEEEEEAAVAWGVLLAVKVPRAAGCSGMDPDLQLVCPCRASDNPHGTCCLARAHTAPCCAVPCCAMQVSMWGSSSPGPCCSRVSSPPGCDPHSSSLAPAWGPTPHFPKMEDERLWCWHCPDVAIPLQGTPRNQEGAHGTSHAACARSPRSVPTTPAAPLGSSAAPGSVGSAASPQQKTSPSPRRAPWCSHHRSRSGAEAMETAPMCRNAATAAVATSACRERQLMCSQRCPARGQGKDGFCPAYAGLFPSYDCRAWCWHDDECPGKEKCCLSGCDYVCLPPSQEKPGICPLAEEAPLATSPCGTTCIQDWQCPGAEKCCSSSRCGPVCLAPEPGEEKVTRTGLSHTRHVKAPGGKMWDGAAIGQLLRPPGCSLHSAPRLQKKGVPTAWCGPCPCCPFLPISDKPGKCPKVRPQQISEPCLEKDSCAHDRDCPRQEKCCFSGCAMCCTRPAREHPGECPRPEPCWDPRRRRGSQCLDDSVCRREEKCCDTGCGWECVAVPRESQDSTDGKCLEECEVDSQCPRGQRCTSIGCGHVCMDIPGGRVGVCPIPREGGTCLDLCNFDEECPWGHKCCSNGCGHVCMPASLQERDTAAVPRHGAERCTEQCEADSQCPWGQRCTRTSCGRVCKDTPGGETENSGVSLGHVGRSSQLPHGRVLCLAGRGGACPVPRGRGSCLDLCSLDEECPWGHKCCSNGCGHVCTRVSSAAVDELLTLLAGGVEEEAAEERLAVPTDRGQVAEVCMVQRGQAEPGQDRDATTLSAARPLERSAQFQSLLTAKPFVPAAHSPMHQQLGCSSTAQCAAPRGLQGPGTTPGAPQGPPFPVCFPV